MELVKIEPEGLEVANTYLQTMDMKETARELGISLDTVEGILANKAVRSYVDTVFLEVGYNNRYKLHDAMDSIIDKKFEELDETDMASTKDIAELLMMKHKMRMDELAAMAKLNPAVADNTKNIQVNNYGENYGQLMEKLLK